MFYKFIARKKALGLSILSKSTDKTNIFRSQKMQNLVGHKKVEFYTKFNGKPLRSFKESDMI